MIRKMLVNMYDVAKNLSWTLKLIHGNDCSTLAWPLYCQVILLHFALFDTGFKPVISSVYQWYVSYRIKWTVHTPNICILESIVCSKGQIESRQEILSNSDIANTNYNPKNFISLHENLQLVMQRFSIYMATS